MQKGYIGILPFCPHGVGEEVLVGEADAIREGGGGVPTERGGSGDVKKFAGGAVWAGGIPFYVTFIAHNVSDKFGEGTDGELLTCAGIDSLVATVVVHQEDAEIGEVIDIEKLTQRASIAPAGDTLCPTLLGFVEPTDKGGKDMGMLGMVVIVGAIEVSGHDADIVGAILAVEELAVFESANLGQSIGLVGFLKGSRKQATLGHGLWCHAWIDTGGAQEKEFAATILPCGVDDIHLKGHVVVHEIGKGVLVGHDASDLGGSKKDVFGFLLSKELLYGILTAEVKFGMGTSDDVVITLVLQFSDNGRAYHATMTCDVN